MRPQLSPQRHRPLEGVGGGQPGVRAAEVQHRHRHRLRPLRLLQVGQERLVVQRRHKGIVVNGQAAGAMRLHVAQQQAFPVAPLPVEEEDGGRRRPMQVGRHAPHVGVAVRKQRQRTRALDDRLGRVLVSDGHGASKRGETADQGRCPFPCLASYYYPQIWKSPAARETPRQRAAVSLALHDPMLLREAPLSKAVPPSQSPLGRGGAQRRGGCRGKGVARAQATANGQRQRPRANGNDTHPCPSREGSYDSRQRLTATTPTPRCAASREGSYDSRPDAIPPLPRQLPRRSIAVGAGARWGTIPPPACPQGRHAPRQVGHFAGFVLPCHSLPCVGAYFLERGLALAGCSGT